MFIEDYAIDTRHTTNTGDHRITIDYVEGVYIVSREIDGTADAQAERDTLEEARSYAKQNYFI